MWINIAAAFCSESLKQLQQMQISLVQVPLLENFKRQIHPDMVAVHPLQGTTLNKKSWIEVGTHNGDAMVVSKMDVEALQGHVCGCPRGDELNKRLSSADAIGMLTRCDSIEPGSFHLAASLVEF